ncbi:MAG TPA: hypothetical protein VGA64_11590, partial [Candidatus Polarisedimenticolia bacterium]
MTAILLLVLEALALLALCADLARDFVPLGGGGRSLLVLVALAGAVLTIAKRRGRPIVQGLRGPIAVLAAGSLLVGALGAVQTLRVRRIMMTWDDGARDRLERRARLLDEDAAWFLDEMLRTVRAARLPAAAQDAAFDTLAECASQSRLPRERQGFSLYRADGSLLAWQGNSEPVPPELLAGTAPGPIYRIGNDEASQRLYAILRSPRDGLTWVSEFLLRPPAGASQPDDRASFLEFLPRFDDVGPAHVHLRAAGSAPDDLDRFFERQADRYWGRVGRTGVVTLSFPLRSPAGDALAIVTLKDLPAEQASAEVRTRMRRVGALAAALLFLAAASLVLRRRPRPFAAFLAGTAGLWSARWALLAVGAAGQLPRISIFDISLYATPGLGGLLRSPADLFLTTVVSLTQVALFQDLLMAVPPPVQRARRTRARRWALGGCAAVGLLGILGLHDLL